MPKRKGSSAAQKATVMAQQKRAAEEERRREELDGETRDSDKEEDVDRELEREPHEEEGSKGNCLFAAKTEERLVEFFSANSIFYDKCHPHYHNQQKKDKLLDEIAKELNTSRLQIQGWFKHMRTSVGKLYKTKSGQATKPLTARKKWQLQNFVFLKAHIVPRTYSVETTQLEEAGEQSEDEESLHSITTRPASPSPSTSTCMATRKTKPPANKKSKIDELLMKFLDRPRPEEVLSKQLETIAAAPAPVPPQLDERAAFSQWITTRISGIPPDRWDDFQFAAMRLLQDYSSPRPIPDTFPYQAQPRPRPPAQQQWPHFSQQQQQWGPMQTWQQQWPQRQQQQWGDHAQEQLPSQQVWQQPSASSHPQIQLHDAPLNTTVTAQPVRQNPEFCPPRSQSVPPILESSITGSGFTDVFMKAGQEAALQTASLSGSQEDSGDD